jgi:GntR family transcriptional regulator
LTEPEHPYEHVAEDLRRRIRSGEFPPGSKLPTGAELREEYKYSSIVINRAIWILNRDGWTKGQRGVGVFVQDHAPTE